MTYEIRAGGGLACAAALALAGFAAVPASAGGIREISCQEIVRTDDGRFTYRSAPFSVLRDVRAPGPFAYENSGGVVAFSCARSTLVPQVDDVEVLQAGYGLTIGTMRGGIVLLELSLESGRVAYSLNGGELSPRERREVDAVVARMQARLESSPSAPAAQD